MTEEYNGKPVFIWGSGEVGTLVHEKLTAEGIMPAGYVVDDGCQGGGVWNKRELEEKQTDYLIAPGFLGAFSLTEEEILRQWRGCSGVVVVSNLYEPKFAEPINMEYWEQNRNRFEAVRNSLADELSVKSFDAFLTARTENTNRPLQSCVIPTQYFFEGAPWNYDSEDVLVDCGAFTGDSILDFIKLRGEAYKEIVALEPDRDNYIKLENTVREHRIRNVTTENVGAYREKTELSFVASGDMLTHIAEDSVTKLQVDSIDNICRGKDVSIIKMDIEGAELDALKGARRTIMEHTPILMVSAYHKRDDLFVLADYIRELSEDYVFYFRCHKPLAIDAVLYAVPPKRIVR